MIRRIQTQHMPDTPFVSLASTVYADQIYSDPSSRRWSWGHASWPASEGSTIHRVDIGPLVVQWESYPHERRCSVRALALAALVVAALAWAGPPKLPGHSRTCAEEETACLIAAHASCAAYGPGMSECYLRAAEHCDRVFGECVVHASQPQSTDGGR
jgi:hypothetical protein